MTDDRDQHRRDLRALNSNLRNRYGVDPLVTEDAADSLDDDNLRAAVKVTGDYLVDTARKLAGAI